VPEADAAGGGAAAGAGGAERSPREAACGVIGTGAGRGIFSAFSAVLWQGRAEALRLRPGGCEADAYGPQRLCSPRTGALRDRSVGGVVFYGVTPLSRRPRRSGTIARRQRPELLSSSATLGGDSPGIRELCKEFALTARFIAAVRHDSYDLEALIRHQMTFSAVASYHRTRTWTSSRRLRLFGEGTPGPGAQVRRAVPRSPREVAGLAREA